MKLNCDLGEWETLKQSELIMQNIELANIACGGHAGSPKQLVALQEMALKYEVSCGMHPGFSSDKGRGDVSSLSVCEFYDILESQSIFFKKYAGKPLHLKLHGSLYHLSESNLTIREALLDFAISEHLDLIAIAGGNVVELAKKLHHTCLAEGFIDRGYTDEGLLLPRSSPDAQLKSTEALKERHREITKKGGLSTVSGHFIKLDIDTVCIHSDSAKCLEFLDSANFMGR